MTKKVSVTSAKNNFGGLLEDVAARGRVDIVQRGRVVAVLLSPRHMQALEGGSAVKVRESKHMIPAKLARAARMVRAPSVFDDD